MTRVTPSYLRVFAVACVSVGLWAMISAPCSAETPGDYSRLLAATSRQLRTVLASEKQRPGSQTQALKDAADGLPSSICVTQSDGSPINVDLKPIRESLRIASDSKPRARLSRVESVIGTVETMETVSGGRSGGSARFGGRGQMILNSVLSGREYRRDHKEEFMQSLMRTIFAALDKLHVPGAAIDVLAWLLLVIAVVGFVIVLVMLVLRLVSSISFGSRPRLEVQESQEAPREAISLASVLAEAEREAAAGRFAEAFRRIYLASILSLDRAKLVKYADGVTNWEYLRALLGQNRPDAVAAFRPLTESFDQFIYGKRGVSERDYRESFRYFQTLEEAL